ncbi:MAG: hypothetical protein PHD00_10765 [Bacteroidales bacterium]|nr:hypothetical protein [Bacteroidales bacterium]MDD4672864.1 hypothetical protein [Bacteroidales bacterium]MDY0348184.1 hypothetical protein [Tenuifilaceae bacterium]
MKAFYVSVFLLAITFQTFSQETPAEKRVGGLQVGLINNNGGVAYYHEQIISHNFTLRGEAIVGFGWLNKSIICAPTLAIQPRWYYNLNKREASGNDITRNSANFLGLHVSYKFPYNLGYNSNISQWESNGFKGQNSVNLAANWGVRRALGSRLNYEVGVGLGYRYYTNKDYRLANAPLFLSLSLRFGFDIYK